MSKNGTKKAAKPAKKDTATIVVSAKAAAFVRTVAEEREVTLREAAEHLLGIAFSRRKAVGSYGEKLKARRKAARKAKEAAKKLFEVTTEETVLAGPTEAAEASS